MRNILDLSAIMALLLLPFSAEGFRPVSRLAAKAGSLL